ncbi:hypothetical protein [Devriesea agamarum]|uniref:hypothetical protein n=1 Tax=Devriesea agamarum TaxID=472569 RepID=UPI00071D32C9|nr:hypothetical protein [Devriesea agamarum]
MPDRDATPELRKLTHLAMATRTELINPASARSLNDLISLLDRFAADNTMLRGDEVDEGVLKLTLASLEDLRTRFDGIDTLSVPESLDEVIARLHVMVADSQNTVGEAGRRAAAFRFHSPQLPSRRPAVIHHTNGSKVAIQDA